MRQPGACPRAAPTKSASPWRRTTRRPPTSRSSIRPLREATIERARRFIPLPYDEDVAEQLAELLTVAAAERRRAGAMDAIIAATALVHGLAVWTQDDDFEVLAELAPHLVVVVRG